VGAGDRTHGEDDRDQGGRRGEGVLQQLQAGVVGAQPLGGDAGADDGGEQEGRAHELGQGTADKVRLLHSPRDGAGMSSPSKSRTRSSIWSRMARTWSRLRPAGSGSSQSR
jgi:hypothetical protein